MNSKNINYKEMILREVYRTTINNLVCFSIVFSMDDVNMEKIVSPSKFNYSGIIDMLVRIKYPEDKMQAIINNYLLDPTDTDVLTEFTEMQNYRKECKSFAKKILAYHVK